MFTNNLNQRQLIFTTTKISLDFHIRQSFLRLNKSLTKFEQATKRHFSNMEQFAFSQDMMV